MYAYTKRARRAPLARKRGRARPQTLLQSTGSTAHPFVHNEDMDTGVDVDAPLLYDVNTNVFSAVDTMITDDATIDILADDNSTINDDMDTDINVASAHIYTWTRPEGVRKTLLDPGA